jgi:crotonobetainyl-CoA:carnitine CoA-transferase CaiB-like acyl-CoA transferase
MPADGPAEPPREGAPPLEGLRVIDLGHALAGPFAATLLGDFGAEILKIERPGRGDAMRGLGPRKDGVPVWWKAAARNKKSVTLDFQTAAGRDLLLRLVRESDVVVESFRPGTLERHDLGWDVLSEANPRLVMLRISGFGQTGPSRTRPGFGRIAEAMSGAAHLTGEADGPPLHAGYSLADMSTGLMGAFGVLLALVGRERDGVGDCIDLALYEPLFRLIDWQILFSDQLGTVPVRAGNQFPAILQGVAAGVAESADGVWMSYSAATDSVLVRLITVVVGDDALTDRDYATADARRESVADVQRRVERWIAERPAAEVERVFGERDAVVGRVFDVKAIERDPVYRERGNLVSVSDPDWGEVRMHGVVPRLLGHPGAVQTVGPGIGEHTREVLGRLAGVGARELDELTERAVI